MIVICEECGKKYRVNPEQIKGSTTRFKCKSCNYLVLVKNPNHHLVPPADSEPQTADTGPPATGAPADPGPRMDDNISDLKVTGSDTAKLKGMGLRTKMLILFFAVPIIIITVSGLLYLWQLDELSRTITGEEENET